MFKTELNVVGRRKEVILRASSRRIDELYKYTFELLECTEAEQPVLALREITFTSNGAGYFDEKPDKSSF